MKKFNYGIFKDCYFKKENYLNNNNTSVRIYGKYEEDYDEPISVISINTETIYPDGIFVMKNYNECKDTEVLIELGFFRELGIQSVGNCICPVVGITDKFKEYCSE